ncbi:MAG: alpha/beta fold hydrolase [Burkholderiales bacterium]|nr:alpha/beta fold hydrolase [Burkholderiales bacterium]
MAVAAAAAVVVLLGGAAEASTPLALKPCRLDGHPTELQCGTLQRPLNPAEPGGKTISLRVVVVPALARNKLPDPVTLLAGGPGQAAAEMAPLLAPRYARLNQRRDLVFVDQRGTGESAPLECKVEEEAHRDTAAMLDMALQYQLVERCRERLMKLPHGDLRFYTTTIAMQDLDAVRQALGAPQWNLIGVSYGTRAALEYLRLFPQAVRRTVVDGLAPADIALPKSFSVDTQAALDALLASCAAQSGCQAAYPQLAEQWQQLLARLPQKVTLRHPVTGKALQATLEREHVVLAARPPLYAPALSAALPGAIAAAARGEFDGLLALSSGLMGRRGGLATGMHFSVVCAEDLPQLETNRDAPGRDYAAYDLQRYQRICANWPRGAVEPGFYKVPAAQSPVLLTSGGADPVTPPRHGERVAKALGAKALHVVVPAAGHGVINLPCMREVVARFVEAKSDDEALAVKTDCAKNMPRALAFVPPNPELPPVKKNESKEASK